MKDNKYITRFMAMAALTAFVYSGYNMIAHATAGPGIRPNLHLTTGEEIDPASAPVTTKFVKDTAKAFAEEIFADAEAAPDLNEFLSRFTCAACGKRCLLAAPRCSVGNGSKGKATEIYQEMYPDVELFYIGEDIYSLL